MVEEYMFIIRDEVFRVYAYSKQEAIKVFISACDKYMDTDNNYYVEYWNSLKKSLQSGKCTIIQNTDFIGIRKAL